MWYESGAERSMDRHIAAPLAAAMLFVALAAEVIPLGEWWVYKPDMPALAIVYIVTNGARGVRYWWVALVGFLSDLAHFAPLGQYAVVYILIAWQANALRGRFALLGPVAQALYVFILLAAAQLLQFGFALLQNPATTLHLRLFAGAALGASFWLALPLLIGRLKSLLGVKSRE